MKRIFVCSPFAGPTPEVIAFNVEIARRLCAEVLAAGHAPYAPHLYLPQILDDNDPAQRAMGIAAGHAWLEACDEVWCWSMNGGFVSAGMDADLRVAMKLGKPVLYPWGKPDGFRPLDPSESRAFVEIAAAPSLLDGEVRTLPVSGQTFVIRKPQHATVQSIAATPPRPTPTPIRRSLPVETMPDDFRDTDVLDPDVADFVAEVDAAISLSHQLPSKADDFSSSVREKLENIREWCVANNAYTEAQQTAVDNMEGGMRMWIR